MLFRSAWAGQAAGNGGLVDFGEIECEIGGNVGVGCVDAAVEDGDADAGAEGLVPWASRGASGDSGSVSAGLADGPALRRGGVVGVVGRGWWRDRGWCGCGGSADGDADGGWEDMAKDEVVSGENAVMDDEFDVGLGAECGDGGGFVRGGVGLKDGDAEGLVDAEDAGSGDAGEGFGIAGDGAVAVGDQVAMWDDGPDGAGGLLRRRVQGGDEGAGDCQNFSEEPQQSTGLACGVRRVGLVRGEDDAPRYGRL